MSDQERSMEGLVNEMGIMSEIYFLFDPDTIQTSAEIMNARRDDVKLRETSYWPANFALYRVENDEEILYFGGREANPIFKNIKKATTKLIRDRIYKPNKEAIQAVVDSVESGSTIRVILSELNLIPPDWMVRHVGRSKKRESRYDWREFRIDTSDYARTLNDAQMALAEKGFGEGDDFVKNMKMLNESGIETTEIPVLYPPYVRNNVKKDGAIVRTCHLANFSNGSWLSTGHTPSYEDKDGYREADEYGTMRGVLRSVS